MTDAIASDATVADNPYRLPRSVVPHRYTLALQPDLAAATFVGHVIIDATVNEAVTRIVLNADELDITDVKVGGEEATFELDVATERLVINSSPATGTTTIEITFTGTLNDKLRGWYRSTYTDADGSEQVIAASQMQATDCRRAFPCFDEPDFKAVFDVTLIIEPHLMAISNGPEIERTTFHDGSGNDTGKVAVRFGETMPMSTYLVAFVVGNLEATEPVLVPRAGAIDDFIPLRIIHVPGKGHLTAFGLDIGAHALSWYQHYYGIPYPTDKCDMLALPDFAAGAMENLGAITYRESLLLADPTTATQVELQNLADVVAHEMAHMWFGDLVTMKWWNGIWLNEAFATFMEVACCDAYRPDWLRWTTFSLERSAAFEVDSLASTRTVEFFVEAPADCDGMFDVLTYQKGGSLLRMLEQYLGEAAFQSGVSHYLSKHEYANTETGDLWDAIEDANPGTPVRALMDSWIWQAGYPLISARLDGSELVLSQQRFAYGETHDATLFVVPVHLRIDGVESKVLLDGFDLRVELPSADSNVVVNAGGHGYMRVAYDAALRARILGQLDELTTVDRYNLIDDAWNEVVAGRLDAIEFVEFVEGFGANRELAVWQAIAIGLRGVGRLLDGTAYTALQQRVAALVSPALDGLGRTPVAEEGDLVGKLRGLLVGMLAVLGNDAATIAQCRATLEAYDRGESVDPELVSAATNAVAAHGTDTDYDEFVAKFRNPATPQEQLRYLYALAEFPEAAQIERTVALAFSGEVRTQNAPFLLNRCLSNRHHGAATWQTLRQQWGLANEKFPGNTISRMIDPVKLLTAPEVVADVQSFFSEHPIAQARKGLEQILERQRVNAALRAREAVRLPLALE
ncbi:MAG TPA: M1 family metallopeptidase [Ilumatobacteraceae bacterium]|nr:M1 family metallopeptidase [Ilumatobacteraceae bacterium]HRB04351.1 M1 family metallopeptidase [Ilumatobacteraceae bacterium]